MKSLGIIIIIILNVLPVIGQQTFKESKLFTETYEYKKGDKVKVTGERTFITIETWEKAEVKAEVEVISRYSDKTQAQSDLEKIQVNFKKNGSTIYYNNALNLSSAKEKPKANLKTTLRLYVPEKAEVEITNSFGELTLDGSVQKMTVGSQFSVTHIKNYKGELKVTSKYDKLEFENTEGSLEITSNRSDLILNRAKGEVSAEVLYGNLKITQANQTKRYEIKAEYSPVTLIIPADVKEGLEISCSSCDVNMDNCGKISDEKISRGKHRVTIGGSDSSKRTIKSTKEDVTIITTNSLTNSN